MTDSERKLVRAAFRQTFSESAEVSSQADGDYHPAADIELLEALEAGVLTEVEYEKLREHIAQCPQCREMMAEFIRSGIIFEDLAMNLPGQVSICSPRAVKIRKNPVGRLVRIRAAVCAAVLLLIVAGVGLFSNSSSSFLENNLKSMNRLRSSESFKSVGDKDDNPQISDGAKGEHWGTVKTDELEAAETELRDADAKLLSGYPGDALDILENGNGECKRPERNDYLLMYARACFDVGDFSSGSDQEVRCYEKARSACEELLSRKGGKKNFEVNSNLAVICRKLGETKKARKYSDNAYKIYEKAVDKDKFRKEHYLTDEDIRELKKMTGK